MGEGTRDAALAAARRSGLSLGEWLDEVISQRSSTAAIAVAKSSLADHSAEMEAIAEQLSRLSDGDGPAPLAGPSAAAKAVGDLSSSAAIRRAVAEIAKRQADLDGHAESSAARDARPTAVTRPTARRASEDRQPGGSGFDLMAPPPRWTPTGDAGSRFGETARTSAAAKDPGPDLTSEVSQTFARFSRDLHDAIQATDARPKVDALDRQMRRIGRAVDGLGANLPTAESLDRIGGQTREVRDLLRASSDRALPLDVVAQQVSSLEQRLARLVDVPVDPGQPPHLDATMREVRALLDGFAPGATMAALDARLDDLTARIERGLATQGSSGLIEGLTRRVEEIHATLHTKLAETEGDGRPLENLVRGLSNRLGQAHAASTDLDDLEIAMRDVASSVDAPAGHQDPRGVRGVEAQLARLTERLDRSDASLRALDGVEQSLGELFSQFEATRQVAIDAAETAARTAARDTLRAALQTPGLTSGGPTAESGLADQVARGLEELRALQDSAQRRTETTLSDLRAMMERLTKGPASSGIASRGRAPNDDHRRRPAAPDSPAPDIDPSDVLIEPGLGRAPIVPQSRPEPRIVVEPEEDGRPAATVEEADGSASFIAAARRAAKAAQASAASTAAQRGADRRTQGPRLEADREPRRSDPGIAGESNALLQAKRFLARRRRPLLLGLAALVLLVGALEVARLGTAPADGSRVGAARIAPPAQTKTASADAQPVPAKAPDAAVLPPVTAPAAPPLPTFVAGPAKPPTAAVERIGDGLRNLAMAGDAGAQYEIGLRYAEGRGVARDPKQAVAWFAKSAAQGSAPAEYRLGSAYEKGVGADRDPALAMNWYAKAAEAGNIRAMHNLAVMSAEGAAGKPDYAKAAQWFAKAAEFGVRDSQFNLAILYARGLGIEQSLEQSYKWFAVAASAGDDDSAKKRDEVAAKLDPTALAAAKTAVAAYHPTQAARSANEVSPPPGGWDAASPASGAAAPSKVSQL